MAWVDYSKAFDRVTHQCVRYTLKAAQAPRFLRKCVRNLMKTWSSEFSFQTNKGMESVEIQYRRGGDSLSPLLFCLSTAQLSWDLSQRQGVCSKMMDRQTTHTLFVDDLKVYARSKPAVTVGGDPFPTASSGSPYKYLGVLQVFAAKAEENKASVTSRYLERLRKVWSSELLATKQVELMNAWAVGVYAYYYAFLGWGRKELRAVDVLTRKILYEHKAQHPQAAIERLYLPRKKGNAVYRTCL